MTNPVALHGRHTGSSRQILARLLDTPDLATAVPSLPAPALARLVDAVGLEDAGALVAFATPAQLAEVLDDDLWRSDRPGGDERFDGDRFLTWLSVMMEAGDAFVAARLAALPEDLVALALHEHVLVLDLDELFAGMRALDEDDGTAIEKVLASQLCEELDRYRLVSRRHDGWDTVLAAVLALDRDHHALLARLLDRLCAATAEHVEREGGLCSALSAAEMLESDAGAEREDRRARRGFVAPADARAFLRLASEPVAALPVARDAVTHAYFRALARHEASSAAAARAVAEAGVGASARLGSGDTGPREPLLVAAMRALAELDAAAFAARGEELVYLANVLVAGRRDRPADAVRCAVDACSRALELVGDDPVDALRRHPADALFRLAWSRGPGQAP